MLSSFNLSNYDIFIAMDKAEGFSKKKNAHGKTFICKAKTDYRIESFISKAEIAYKSGEVKAAIKHAKTALKFCRDTVNNDITQFGITPRKNASAPKKNVSENKAKQKKSALCRGMTEKAIALKIFIARAYSKLGCYAKSNTIYRGLLRENVYMPPIIVGLLYNNFKTASTEKMKLNIGLVKTCLRLQ